uniref:Cysteine rich secreted protein n=1 Tax=Riptortus pedestris TaxID=329032 RepID=R4WCP4_RIPPE|nr:cysteine rich secreted protein [Riptortus pedestris]
MKGSIILTAIFVLMLSSNGVFSIRYCGLGKSCSDSQTCCSPWHCCPSALSCCMTLSRQMTCCRRNGYIAFPAIPSKKLH